MHIKKGDNVKILSGKDRGKTGKVLRVFLGSDKLVVENANLVKKHQKPKRSGEKGQRMAVPAPINVSNIQIICPKCSKPTRIGKKQTAQSKVRVCKKCGADID
jgi:large subunit ribosomal protein L24